MLLNVILLQVGMTTGFLPRLSFSYFELPAVFPVVAVILTTWLASWAGSRRVLVVSPMQALGAAEERSVSEVVRRPGRNVLAIVTFVVGTFILLGGVALALSPSVLGILVAVFGGMVSFTGVVLSAGLFMPAALRLVGRAMGTSVPARLAS